MKEGDCRIRQSPSTFVRWLGRGPARRQLFASPVRGGETEELRVSPEPLGLSRATKVHVPWRDEIGRVLGALEGEEGPVLDPILYNAALRLWAADGHTPLADHVEHARAAVRSGAVLELLRLPGRVPAPGQA